MQTSSDPLSTLKPIKTNICEIKPAVFLAKPVEQFNGQAVQQVFMYAEGN